MKTALVLVLALGLATSGARVATTLAQGAPAKLTVESTAFKDGEPLPDDYSSFGKNVSPPFSWTGAPATARQFAVVCHDPDAPLPGGFTHWVIYKIPASAKGLLEAVPAGASVTASGLAGAIQGMNGFAAFARRGGPPPEPSYRGPAPPAGPAHHYHFTVYAIDGAVDLQPGLDRNGLLKAIEGHIVAQGEIVGLYQRKS
jgi:Raf kinase inhibitor-like YbhB/YbcL family protein